MVVVTAAPWLARAAVSTDEGLGARGQEGGAMFKDDQENWDIIVAQCANGSFSSINVASERRSRAIMNVDGELKALRLRLAPDLAELDRQLAAAEARAAAEGDRAAGLEVELQHCKAKRAQAEELAKVARDSTNKWRKYATQNRNDAIAAHSLVDELREKLIAAEARAEAAEAALELQDRARIEAVLRAQAAEAKAQRAHDWIDRKLG